MLTGQISTLHHPTLIDQTDRDPHRRREDDASRHRRPAHHQHPHVVAPAAAEETFEGDEHKTIGLLLDVKA
jgi:hypothetical protein